MKTLKFAMGLCDPVLFGEKTITLRKYRPEAHDFKMGEVIIGDFFEDYEGVMFLLRITHDTKVIKAKDISDETAYQDGFNDAKDMMESMKQFYPDWGPDTDVGIIRFVKARP